MLLPLYYVTADFADTCRENAVKTEVKSEAVAIATAEAASETSAETAAASVSRLAYRNIGGT